MRKLLLLATIAFSIVACTSAPASYEVKGTLPDSTLDGKKLYLLRYDDNKYIDSTVVAGKDFVFKGTADTASFCRIDAGRQYTNLVLENGRIEVSFDTHKALPTTPLNAEYSQMDDAVQGLIEEMKQTNKELESTIKDPKELNSKKADYYQNVYRKNMTEMFKTYFLANRNNAVGVRALIEYSYGATPEEVDEVLEQAGEYVLSCNFTKELVQRNAALKNTAEGKLFTDFTIEQEDGTSVSLSDYVGKGKYVLVDFWASWCGPCIQETPVLAEVYNKYKGDKFELLGVAVWDRLDKTKEAIEKHGMNWPQILDAKMKPMELYGISGIPHIILFAPDGTIVERDLRGEMLKAKVAEVMEK